MEMDDTILIPEARMNSEFVRILSKEGFTKEKAEKCAGIFTLNSLEGVYTHGANRFPRFIRYIRKGFVNPVAEPTLIHSSGSLEQWSGNHGPGPLNALFATEQAIKVAASGGIGLVTLANTNHWMRGGTYGWVAARKGFVLFAWTNTCPNMPAWGATDPKLGNNPFIIAIPNKEESVVLDFAMSQYSYGKLETYSRQGKKLPFPGGFDPKGKLTDDPAEILKTMRIIPAGYWKGSSLSLVLDILAAILSGGRSVSDIKTCENEADVSQVFIAIDISRLSNFPQVGSVVDSIIADLHLSSPENKDVPVRYPGENIRSIREKSIRYGISVEKKVWDEILAL